jgi:hypothetical protein
MMHVAITEDNIFSGNHRTGDKQQKNSLTITVISPHDIELELTMRVEHLAIDGSTVSIEAEADLTTPTTATGWAVVPSLMQAHPFTIYPAGHSTLMEQAARSGVASLEIFSIEEYSLKNGKLRVAEVELPAATGGKSRMTVGAWEGTTGCLHTSMFGSERLALSEAFDTLRFSERRGGLAIDSPVTARPRSPEVVKEIPEIGILIIRPGISSELERVPKSRGFMTDHGELFRIRNEGRGLLFVSNSCVVTLSPEPRHEVNQVLDVARRLRVEWSPRGPAVPGS